VVVRVGRRVVAWVVAAAVTVVLVAGGVLVARDRAGRSPAVLPALDLDAGQAGAATAAPAGAGAAVEPAPAAGAAGAARSWPPGTYRLGAPLPALPDRARAWKLGDTPDPGRVAALAAALGLAGRTSERTTGWTVRDGRRALVAQRLAGVPWTYGTGLGGCATRAGGGPYRPGVQCLDPDTPVSSGPVAPARPLPRPGLPTRAEAERVARDLAARAGLDLGGARVRVVDGYALRTVTIAPAVDGLPTSGMGWTVGVGPKGVVRYASGWLATPAAADTYPLIGVAEGFERLKKAPPLGPLARPGAPAVELDPCPAGAKLPCSGGPLPARVATVTGVRLGLQRAPAAGTGDRAGHAAWLLPAYLFDLEGGWTDVRAVVAVPERYLTRP
jgi:hypothetical protein